MFDPNVKVWCVTTGHRSQERKIGRVRDSVFLTGAYDNSSSRWKGQVKAGEGRAFLYRNRARGAKGKKLSKYFLLYRS